MGGASALSFGDKLRCSLAGDPAGSDGRCSYGRDAVCSELAYAGPDFAARCGTSAYVVRRLAYCFSIYEQDWGCAEIGCTLGYYFMRAVRRRHLDFVPADANARNAPLKRICYIVAGLLLVTVMLVADGGTVQFHRQAGPFAVTLFSSPVPLRAGRADLSVMVQKASDNSTIQDANVTVHLKRSATDNVVEVVAPATHAKATNKLLYAAELTIPSPGQWQANVEIHAAGTTATAEGTINVLPQQAAVTTYWGYFALIPFAILLFLFNRWLRRRRQMLYPRTRP